jgi:nitroreductase
VVKDLELWDVLRTRRSIRKYRTDSVPDEKIEKVLEAARIAPSADNRQPWDFVVIRGRQKIRELEEATYPGSEFVGQAPVVIVACANPETCGTRQDGVKYYMVDIGIAFQQLMLAAWELGLGTCWVVDFREDRLRKALSLPHQTIPIALTPLGYPDEKHGMTPRKRLLDIVHNERW